MFLLLFLSLRVLFLWTAQTKTVSGRGGGARDRNRLHESAINRLHYSLCIIFWEKMWLRKSKSMLENRSKHCWPMRTRGYFKSVFDIMATEIKEANNKSSFMGHSPYKQLLWWIFTASLCSCQCKYRIILYILTIVSAGHNSDFFT